MALIDMYDTRTGKKLLEKKPEVFLRLFPYLSPTPRQRAKTTDEVVPDPVEPADEATPESADPANDEEE